MYKDAAFSIGIHSRRRGRLVVGSEQYPLLSLPSTGAALSVCTQSVLLLPNIRIAIDEDVSRPISPRKEYSDPPNRPTIQRSTFQFWATPPSPVQIHKTVRRRNLQSDHRSLAITGEPPSTGAGLDYSVQSPDLIKDLPID